MTFEWEDAWQRGATPWDRGAVAPGLVWWLNEQRAEVPQAQPRTQTREAPRSPQAQGLAGQRGRVLVPGAGHGYDALALAQAGWDVTAVDIAPTAVAECTQRIVAAGLEKQARAVCADFFETPPRQEALQAPFDLLFDYTFCCALPPALRAAWAHTCAQRIKQGGSLLHLAFPLDRGQRSAATLKALGAKAPGHSPVDPGDGPPFVLDLQELAGYLAPNFVLETLALDVPSAPSRDGREALLLWRRR